MAHFYIAINSKAKNAVLLAAFSCNAVYKAGIIAAYQYVRTVKQVHTIE